MTSRAVHSEVVGDRVVLVTQTALSAVSQAAQPAGRRREPGAWGAFDPADALLLQNNSQVTLADGLATQLNPTQPNSKNRMLILKRFRPVSLPHDLFDLATLVTMLLGFGGAIIHLPEGMFGVANHVRNDIERLVHSSIGPFYRCADSGKNANLLC